MPFPWFFIDSITAPDPPPPEEEEDDDDELLAEVVEVALRCRLDD